MDWISSAPISWPKWPRRIFAVTLPVSVPLWLAAWAIFCAAGLALVLSMAALTFFPALIYKIYTGTNEDLAELMFWGPSVIYRSIRDFFRDLDTAF